MSFLKKLLGIKSVSSALHFSPAKVRISYPQEQFLDVGEIDEKFDRTYKAWRGLGLRPWPQPKD